MTGFAFVFPGQGSQSVGMLDAWGDNAVVRQTLQEASDALGEDLEALVRDGPADALALTTNTQPVMLAADIACWRVWRSEGGVLPLALAGHSLGEYAALVAAGALTLADAVPLVRLRASAMQDAVPVGRGAMAAILGLSADQISAVCAQVMQALGGDEVVEAVNFNTPVQTVIAGSTSAVEQACVDLKAAGAKRAVTLPVSAPFHSRLMQPAAERLRQALIEVPVAVPQIPVVNNVDVSVEQDADRIRDALYRQAFRPVRWVETVQQFKTMGAGAVVECGPGKVLAGMTRRIDRDLQSAELYDPQTLVQVQELAA